MQVLKRDILTLACKTFALIKKETPRAGKCPHSAHPVLVLDGRLSKLGQGHIIFLSGAGRMFPFAGALLVPNIRIGKVKLRIDEMATFPVKRLISPHFALDFSCPAHLQVHWFILIFRSAD